MSMPKRILYILFQTLELYVVDYGFWLLTLLKTQLERFQMSQNQGMRTVLGCTKDTSCEGMRHILGYLSMQERHRKVQVKAYFFSFDFNPKKGSKDVQSRPKRGTEWMN